MKEPILITGCARSGTSLISGIIDICGGFGGNMSGPTKYNEKGMFENSAIRQNVVKPYLKQYNVDPLGQWPLPDVNDMVIPTNWRRKVQDIIKKEGLPGGQPWFYKGAKMCLMWPVWNYAFTNAKWVIVRRKTPDIINSCMKTHFMKAFMNKQTQMSVGAKDEYDGWLFWVHHHEDRFREMMDAGLNTTIVWPARIIEGDYRQIKDMIEWLGLEWKSQEVMNFIEPKLWKARKK